MRERNHPVWQLLKTSADRDEDFAAIYGNYAALVYLITGDASYGRKAVRILRRATNDFGSPTWGRNETRETTIESAMLLDWLWPVLTSEERSSFVAFLHRRAALILNRTNEAGWGTRLGDSDETVGHYFGLALIDLVTGSDYLKQTWVEPNLGTLPVGGLDPTAADFKTMRNAISKYVEMANGGEWIESGSYNLGTQQLLFMGSDAVRTATGVDHFPEITAYIPVAAKATMHELTPDLRQSFQWGEEEHPGDLRFWSRGPLLTMLVGLTRDPHLNQFLLDSRAANASDPHNVNPNVRYFYFYNPYLPTEPWRDYAGPFWAAPGQGLVFSRASGTYLGAHFPGSDLVDHAVRYLGDFQVYRDGTWLVSHPKAYLPGPEVHNTVLVANGGRSTEASGLVGAENGDGWAYMSGTTAGFGPTIWEGYYDPPPNYLHEYSRSIIVTGETLVIFDRVHADDPRDLPSYNRYYPNDRASIEAMRNLKEFVLHTPVRPGITRQSITWPGVTVDTLLPRNPQYLVLDETAIAMDGYFFDGQKKFQVRVSPPSKASWDVFLHVLHLGEAKQSYLVESDDHMVVGAVVAGNVMLFSAKPSAKTERAKNGDVAVADKTLFDKQSKSRLLRERHTIRFTATFPTEVFVADLDPAMGWSVSMNQSIVPLTVSKNGLAHFNVSITGTRTQTLEISPKP